MRTNRLMLWAFLATLVAVLLNVGCRQQVFSLVNPAGERQAGSIALPAPGPLPAPGTVALGQKGTVVLTIQWPRKSYAGFSAQTIPYSTDKIEIQVKQGGATVQTATLTTPFATPTPSASATPRPCCSWSPEPTASVDPVASASIKTTTTFTLDAGDYDFEAQAFRGAEQIAKANALVTVVGGAENPAYLPLGPLFAPTVTGLSVQGAGPGAAFKIFGTNFGSGSIDSIPIEATFGEAKLAITRLSSTELQASIPGSGGSCFYCPPSWSGDLVVKADGVEMSTQPIKFFGLYKLYLGPKASEDIHFADSKTGKLYLRQGETLPISYFGVHGLTDGSASATISAAVSFEASGAVSVSGDSVVAQSAEGTGSLTIWSGNVKLTFGSYSWDQKDTIATAVSPWKPLLKLPVPTPRPSASWFSSSVNKLHFVDDNVGWAVGGAGTIFKTVDGGNTWATQSSGVTLDLKSVSFADSQRGLVGGDKGLILRTTDGGSSWSVASVPSTGKAQVAAILDVVGATGSLSMYWDTYSTYRSTDQGTNWASYGYTNFQPFFRDTAFYAMRKYGTSFYLVDGNLNVSTNPLSVSTPSVIVGSFALEYLVSPSVLFGTATIQDAEFNEVQTLFRSMDGGNSWTAMSPWSTSIVSSYFADQNMGLARTMYNNVTRTMDGGKTWFGDSVNLNYFTFSSSRLGWGINGNLLYKYQAP